MERCYPIRLWSTSKSQLLIVGISKRSLILAPVEFNVDLDSGLASFERKRIFLWTPSIYRGNRENLVLKPSISCCFISQKFTKSLLKTKFQGAYLFGHPGYGGQQIIVDLHTQTTLVYVSNGLKTGSGELCKTYMRLFKSVYRLVCLSWEFMRSLSLEVYPWSNGSNPQKKLSIAGYIWSLNKLFQIFFM